MLGSIDSNTGSPDLGWDTDQFPMDIKNTTMVMKVGSLSPNSLYLIELLVYKKSQEVIKIIIWLSQNLKTHPFSFVNIH